MAEPLPLPPKKKKKPPSTPPPPPPPVPHVVESRAIRVTHALPLDAKSLQLHGGSKRLRVAAYSEFFPVAYRDKKSSKTMRGFDVDLIEAFSRAAGLQPPMYVRVDDFFDAWK